MQKFCLLFILMGSLVLIIYGCNIKPLETDISCQTKGEAEIANLKKTYQAGEHINIRINTKDLNNEDLLIVWDGKFGEQYFDKTVYSDEFIFNFPDSMSIYSGFVSLKVVHCHKVLARANTYISSLYPVGTIESYLGPKTLAIDQSMQSMLCLIPTDKYGNAMEVSDTISFNTKYNNSPNINVKKGIQNLVSYIKIKNNQKVGKVLLGAKCEDTYIDEQEVAIVQGPMNEVKINIMELHPFSDQRQIARLNTDVILDSKGNIVADGTSVIYVVHEEGEVVAQYQTYTVSGIATVHIENPKHAAVWDVSIAGATNDHKVQLIFRDNIESIPLRIEKNYLIVGPVVGSLDQYIPDGTKVSVTFNHAIHRELEIDHGFVEFEIPVTIMQSKEIICEVEINGQTVKMIY